MGKWVDMGSGREGGKTKAHMGGLTFWDRRRRTWQTACFWLPPTFYYSPPTNGVVHGLPPHTFPCPQHTTRPTTHTHTPFHTFAIPTPLHTTPPPFTPHTHTTHTHFPPQKHAPTTTTGWRHTHCYSSPHTTDLLPHPADGTLWRRTDPGRGMAISLFRTHKKKVDGAHQPPVVFLRQ